MLTRKQERMLPKLLRNNKQLTAKVEAILADQEAYKLTHPEFEYDVNDDCALTLMMQWLDQQRREIEDRRPLLSDCPPRLLRLLESIK